VKVVPRLVPPPLCGHGLNAIPKIGKTTARCSVCGSFWDLTALRSDFKYDASYPVIRGHNSETVGRLKVRSLERWLDALHLELAGLRVCELGFGGG
jgi:hypothetical protein